MAKKSKSNKLNLPGNDQKEFDYRLQEPSVEYPVSQRLKPVADFTHAQFLKIAARIDFTQKDWANILHLSERTLQRYTKNNTPFEGLYADKILHIEQLIRNGLEAFPNASTLYNWLKKEKQVMGHLLNFESLYTTQGIQELNDQLVRIQYSVYT